MLEFKPSSHENFIPRTSDWWSRQWLMLGCLILISSCGAVKIAWSQETEKHEMEILDMSISTEGWMTFKVQSHYQAGPTEIRLLLPADIKPDEQLPVAFVLPVEAGREDRYGDGLTEIVKHKLHEQHRAIYVAPTFFHLPWYIDHASDKKISQERYFMKHVVPFVLEEYPVSQQRSDRYLLGFSKSGWGAVSLLVRHPDMFEKAAAWDAPFMMETLGKYGTTPVFGDQQVLDQYALPTAIRSFDHPAELNKRLILTSYGSFRAEHQAFHALLDELNIKHTYRDGPQRKHDWHSGWVAESLELLFKHKGD